MRLDERRKPQDGRFSARIDGRRIDFRVSTFPSYYGEKVEMRILDQAKGIRTVDKLGLSDKNLVMLREAINKPYGMILITGPTGSGKSTTLYSLLTEIDRESYNVLSLEDPVEYTIEGVSQSQVRPEIGYSFDTGLRTTLRQDPDVIMVGEIRDKETAQLAVQAALTGHLVLSTLHTNDAAGVIPRLIDMGVDPAGPDPHPACRLAHRHILPAPHPAHIRRPRPGLRAPHQQQRRLQPHPREAHPRDQHRHRDQLPGRHGRPQPLPGRARPSGGDHGRKRLFKFT